MEIGTKPPAGSQPAGGSAVHKWPSTNLDTNKRMRAWQIRLFVAHSLTAAAP